MVGGRLGLRGVAVAPEFGGDDGEVLGEPGGDLVPHDVGLRVVMEQQERGPLPPRRTRIVASPAPIIADSKPSIHSVRPYPLEPGFGFPYPPSRAFLTSARSRLRA